MQVTIFNNYYYIGCFCTIKKQGERVDADFRDPASIGEESWGALIYREPTKSVVKISVNSRCKKAYQK